MKKRTDLPDWTDLRFFVELARRGGLSAAARSLGVTHATVARRIATLEAALGHSLFQRRSGRYVLTAEGERILALATPMEDQALSIARAAAGLVPELAGPVRVTTTEIFGSSLIAPRLRDLRVKHPGIQIELMADNSNLSLARREADIAIRHGRPTADHVMARRLPGLAYNLYAARSLLRDQNQAALGYIGYDATDASRPEAQHFARLVGDARIVLRTNSLAVRIAAARAGLGIALLPRFAAEEIPELSRVEANETPMIRDLWLLVHRDLKDVPRIRECAEFIQQIVVQERARLE